MRIAPVTASYRPRRAVREDSDLSAIILSMIGTNALAAFAQSISPVQPARGLAGTSDATGAQASAGAGGQDQRKLEAVPPQPARPLPRGSLLDLRV